MYVTTFYSYRGGVGRTTALVNAAIELAHRGRNVLVVDFDLQAPDLTAFEPFAPTAPSLGVVEYLAEYLKYGRAPYVGEYLYRVDPTRLEDHCGEVWVMPAGRGDDEYWQALDQIDWMELYELRDGFKLFACLRQQWAKGDEERQRPDYVLIDTHAGISPQLDTCTQQLADAAVVVFAADWTQFESRLLPRAPFALRAGERVWQRFAAEAEARRQAPLNPDRLQQGGHTDLTLLFVASKVPDQLDQEVSPFEAGQDFLETDELGILSLDAAIPFLPRLLSRPQALVRENGCASSRFAQAYRVLVNAIMMENCVEDVDAARVFLKDLQDHPGLAVERSNISRRSDHARRLDRITWHFENDADVLAQASSCYFRAGRFAPAFAKLKEALDLRRDDPALLWQCASYERRVNPKEAAKVLMRLIEVQLPRPEQSSFTTSEDQDDLLDLDLIPADWLPDAADDPLNLPGLGRISATHAEDSLDRDLPGIDPYIVSAVRALRALREVAPEEYAHARQRICASGLSQADQERLFSDRPPGANPRWLLRCGQWQTAVTLLQPRVEGISTPDLEDLCYLLMAYWGMGDETKARQASQCVVASFRRSRQAGRKLFYTWQWPCLSLAFWKTGEMEKALEVLNNLHDKLSPTEEGSLFSPWRCEEVSPQQFLEDCDLLRDMIKGLPIRPRFFGKGEGFVAAGTVP